jgi:hypothetical protein
MDSTTLSQTQTRVYHLAVEIQDLLQSGQPGLYADKLGNLCVSTTSAN